jgi:hypothetical protein
MPEMKHPRPTDEVLILLVQQIPFPELETSRLMNLSCRHQDVLRRKRQLDVLLPQSPMIPSNWRSLRSRTGNLD